MPMEDKSKSFEADQLTGFTAFASSLASCQKALHFRWRDSQTYKDVLDFPLEKL